MDEYNLLRNLYRKGKYDECLKILDNLIMTVIENSDDVRNKSSTVSNAWKCILVANKLCCTTLINVHKHEADLSERILDSLFKQYQLNRSIPDFPQQLKLNLLYNYLYWYWFQFYTFSSVKRWTVISVIMPSLINGLRYYDESYIVSNHDNMTDLERFLDILKRLSNHTLITVPVESIQLLDIVHVSCLVLYLNVTHNADRDQIDFKCLGECFLKSLNHLRLHLKPTDTRAATKLSIKQGYFKLGFKQLNTVLELTRYKSSLLTFSMTMAVFYMKYGLFKDAAVFLENVSSFGCGEEFFFLFNYLKAYVCFHLNQLSECGYLITQLHDSIASTFEKARLWILNGLLNSKLGNQSEAIVEFNKVLFQSKCCKTTALYYTAIENKRSNLYATYMYCMQQMVQEVKSSPSEYDCLEFDRKYCLDYENKLLSILHPQPEITLCDALYFGARHQLQATYYKTAASTYNELLETMKKNTSYKSGSIIDLPDDSIIYHEAILANFKASNMKNAVILANQAIDYYTIYPAEELFNLSGSSLSIMQSDNVVQSMQTVNWRRCLRNFEEDVIALLLLSDIYKIESRFEEQLDMLNRCYNAVLSFMNASLPSKGKNPQKDDSTEFCNLLMCKILLRKAHSYFKMDESSKIDACFRKALTYKPDDKDVIYHYRDWLKSTNQTCILEFVAESGVKSCLDVSEDADFALTYLFQSDVKENQSAGDNRSVPTPMTVDDNDGDDDDLWKDLFED